ncbi:PD-(D/E)XK nuclease family protein [Saccharicrinis sp. FJH62]|uniref:PD-(D/E)XK nuclease family protein n=1 Tax=Saccharicrinis sp. FJH62 TaxID=3344657 RepID=UPI0035D4CE0A
MELFLQQVARHLIEHHKKELHSYWLVFPNKRTSLFFKTWLSQLTDDPVFVPPSFSIDEFIAEFTGLEEIDQLGALFNLYKIHQQATGSEDTFDDFYFWGEMLINDFDDLDKYLVDAKQLYTNLLNLKEIDQYFMDQATEEEERIRHFWEELFRSKKPGTKEFLQTWEKLYPVYQAFRMNLKSQNLGTKGMLYRDAVENIFAVEPEKLPFKSVGFVGFNALTKAEDQIFTVLQKTGKARFFWDYTREMITSDTTRAGFFLKKQLKRFPGVFDEPAKQNPGLNIEVIAVSSSSAQATVAGKILEQQNDIPGLNTAVVMADESLLQTMLNKVPSNVQDLNITMGYPVKNSQVSALLGQITNLQQRVRYQKGMPNYYFKLVLQLLSNNILQRVAPHISELRNVMKDQNLYYVPSTFFKDDPVLKLIFTPVENGKEVINYLIRIFEMILLRLNSDQKDEETEPVIDTEKEMLFALYTRLIRAGDLFGSAETVLPGRDLIFKLVKRIADNITLPFEGEPLKGLQLMGILETRNLEFENLIILSANEGFLPSTSHGTSFIPFNLRKGFGLPTVEEQDAMYAYYFYRLIYRAKNVHLIYDSSSQGVNTGEPSRYIYQLKYLMDIPVTERTVNYEVSLSTMRTITIQKNEEVLQALERFKSGSSALSASSLNAFLDCGLKFYLAYVERIREQDDIQDDIDARIFGNVFHDIMETLYQPFSGKMINRTDIADILKNKSQIEATVKLCFARNFFKNESITDTSRIKGKLLIYVKVLIKYTTKLLEYDMNSCPFKYIEGEKQVQHSLVLTDGSRVNLFGKIDRVDEKDGISRIIDYKSGTINVNTKNQIILKDLDALFDREKALNPDQKAIFQTLFYAMLYSTENGNTSEIHPGIIPIRKLFGKSALSPQIFTSNGDVISYDSDVKDQYEAGLKATIERIFDPELSFAQTDDLKNCEYCDFKNICGR